MCAVLAVPPTYSVTFPITLSTLPQSMSERQPSSVRHLVAAHSRSCTLASIHLNGNAPKSPRYVCALPYIVRLLEARRALCRMPYPTAV